MDYEKKYNEAVCNIQKLLENGRREGEVICAYEADFISIFPELKESEDEKIRKGLIGYFKDFRLGTFAYLEPKKIIAWLEKQGEHSVSYLFTFEDVLTIQCAMAYAKFQDRELNVALKKLHDKVYDAYHDSKNHHIESQDGLKGEQKTVPKFEVGDVMRTLQEAADNITSGLPVVVSINDEYYRCNNELIAIKNQDDYEYPPMNRIQKPAWKPSDEQMEALEKATHIVGSKYKSCLASLYQELNKLRKG